MQQVLLRIPTQASWFLPAVVVLALALGAFAWSLFTRRKAVLPVFLAGAAFLGYQAAQYAAARAPDGIPLYGYGMMLFLAFVACTWLAGRLADREGIAREHVQDLAIYLFIGGVVGSRVVFMIQYGLPLSHFFFIWEGGLVFYGGMLGGAIAYLVAYYTIIKKHNISTLKLADVIAPCAALGLCLGRVGCLLNGCCYGEVACASCPKLEFPYSGMPRPQLVEHGYQTAAGFTIAGDLVGGPPVVGAVEPGSAAERAGLKRGDMIREVNRHEIWSERELAEVLGPGWTRGENALSLGVVRGEQALDVKFAPKTLGLHPTQVFESISTALLLFLLLAYYPFRRHDGELFAIFLMLYPLHRFFNEMLRADNEPVALGLTLSQNGSILVFAIGLVFFLWLRRLPPQYQPLTA
jgi:phosphatidylglycerol:prolipoprotein diacylglycerol transferase